MSHMSHRIQKMFNVVAVIILATLSLVLLQSGIAWAQAQANFDGESFSAGGFPQVIPDGSHLIGVLTYNLGGIALGGTGGCYTAGGPDPQPYCIAGWYFNIGSLRVTIGSSDPDLAD